MTVTVLKGTHKAPRTTPPRMDTLLVSQGTLKEWAIPPVQRPLRVNDKVRAPAEVIKHNGGMIPGILTLGIIEGEAQIWLIDGQHRVEAAKISDMAEMMCDVRVITVSNMAELGEEFVHLNSQLVRFRPDDILRGLEGSVPALKFLKDNCEFVGYNNIRRIGSTNMVGMSQLIRAWTASAIESPRSGGMSAANLAQDMTLESAQQLAICVRCCWSAWGEDAENYRLWAELNLTMTMWLWRKLVLDKDRSSAIRSGSKRYIILNPDQFKKCLLSVAASTDYVDWLLGRGLNDRNKSPAFTRLKTIFANRLKAEPGIGKVLMIQPEWASHI